MVKVFRVREEGKQLFAKQLPSFPFSLPAIVRKEQKASIFTSEHWAEQVAACMMRNKGGEWIVEADTAFEDKTNEETKEGRAFAGPRTIEETYD